MANGSDSVAHEMDTMLSPPSIQVTPTSKATPTSQTSLTGPFPHSEVKQKEEEGEEEEQGDGDELEASRVALLLASPTVSDLESPGDVSLGQTSVVSDQSRQSQHSRAKLIKSPVEKPVSGENTVVIESGCLDDEDLDEASNRCGIGCWSPPCFQRCANVKVFVAFTCVLGVVSSALTTGYLNSVITTIEKSPKLTIPVNWLISPAVQSQAYNPSELAYIPGSLVPSLKSKENTVVIESGCLDDEDLDEASNRCGIGCWSPPCFQRCANVKVFVAFTCVLGVVSSALTTGYLNSVITTIEKRFEIGSSTSGIIAAAYEFGNLVAVIFVSYLGASRHIPKWIGVGVLVMGVGSILFALPHVIAPKYSVRSGMVSKDRDRGVVTSELLNISSITNSSLPLAYHTSSSSSSSSTSRSSSRSTSLDEENICRAPENGGRPGGERDELCFDKNSAGNWGYVLVLVAAQVLIGAGSTPIMTLGITYVDNHVRKDKSPSYLACIHASSALGPVMGYALGALLLQYYVDTFSHEVPISPSSPRWVGAWWGGFIICSVLLLLLAPIFLAYPRVLVADKRRLLDDKIKGAETTPMGGGAVDVGVPSDGVQSTGYGRSYKEIPRAVLSLIKNPVYTIMLPAICCEICIVSGFVVFLPKYIESQFGTTTSQANLFTGGIGIPGAVIGILVGGQVLKRMALSPKGAIQFVLLLNTAALCGFSFFFFMGCNNLKIAGANFPYFNSSGHKIFEANLTSTCNQNCACSPNNIQPICGVNGITYFSPCHAGCTNLNHFYDAGKEEKSLNYSGCSCISAGAASIIGRSGVSHHTSDSNNHVDGGSVVGGGGGSDGGGDSLTASQTEPEHHEVIIAPMATLGACKNRCKRLLPFLILLVGMTFCVAGTQMPLLMVTLRSVRTMERSFALGLQFVVMRLFAYIPSPIFFGNAIDRTCLLWNVKCDRNGSCLLYDIVHFRFMYIGIAAGLKVISLCFFVAVWYFIRRRTIHEAEAAKQASLPESAPLSSELDEKTCGDDRDKASPLSTQPGDSSNEPNPSNNGNDPGSDLANGSATHEMRQMSSPSPRPGPASGTACANLGISEPSLAHTQNMTGLHEGGPEVGDQAIPERLEVKVGNNVGKPGIPRTNESML
ncbi:solute carrier organic anion transporter family member [Plakobranchus ocellatus]|uniref:Solute carrier organic anion transporter family member n=1 Tax=Plakobranchus ocellatus TaxID=259542 RepID=A0AAV4D309_9GAST|nr:solute carrier organic anion transporter family member [Plakobranchus ocellatus]